MDESDFKSKEIIQKYFSKNPQKQIIDPVRTSARVRRRQHGMSQLAYVLSIIFFLMVMFTDEITATEDSKPIDMFVTVDDSESFTQASIERTRTAVHKLIEDLNDTDWRLYLGGLEGVSGNYDRYQINKGSQTLAQAKAAADVALNAIFAVLNSLNTDPKGFFFAFSLILKLAPKNLNILIN